MRSIRSAVIAAAVAALLACASPAHADTVSKCTAGKVNCAIKKTKCKLGCYKKATGSNVVDPVCMQKCEDKFDGGVDLTKGCFEKLENKVPNDCQTFDDTGTMEATIDNFALDIVTDLNATPPSGPISKCLAGKENCVIKKTACKLGCYKKGNGAGSTDPLCLSKCEDKFDGGIDPTKGCFEKLENKVPNDCLTSDDTGAAETKIDAFAFDVACTLDSTRPGCPVCDGSCGDGCLDAGEDCDPPGTQCPNTVAGITCSPTCQCACPTKIEITSVGGPAAFDSGWTGLGHDAAAVDGATFTVSITSCANPNRPCGVCNMTGPIQTVTPGKLNNHRCANNTRLTCTSNSDCVSVGGACEFYFGAFQPLSAGGISTCVENRFNGSFSGTLNAETGDSESTPHLIARVFSDGTVQHPCARCLGDVTPNDGVRNGTCNGGADNNMLCDVNGSSSAEVFGPTSLDCRPSAGTVIGTIPINAPATTGTTTKTLSASSPACRANPTLKCLCDICNTLASEPCSASSDCPPGRTCGGKLCLGGSNNGAACTVQSQCPSGFCGALGENPAPNACNPPDGPPDGCQPIGGNEGECADGPYDGNCGPTATMVGCTSNPDCASFKSCVGGSRNGHTCSVASDCPGGSCDPEQCTFRARPCFLDNGVIGGSVSATGQPNTPVNDAGDGKVGALFCLIPVGSSSVNATAGLPGLFRAELQLHVQGLP